LQINTIVTTVPSPQSAQESKVADGLERAFLSEMLKYAGPRSLEGSFSGGVGESQFASMMTDAYADALSARMDLGLGKKLEGGKA
jgi:Rod binding domain-containing protein